MTVFNDLPLWLVQSEYWAIIVKDPLHITVALFLLTFLLEDAAIAAGAAFAAHGLIAFELAFAGLATGIIIGDYGLYLLGKAARHFKTVRERLPVQSEIFAKNLGLQLLIARTIPGLRLATYPATGIVGVAPLDFMKWILLWGLLWTGGLLFVASVVSVEIAQAISLPPAAIAILFVLGALMLIKRLAKVQLT